MAELPPSLPYDTLPASYSSSDEGIREENIRGSNINLVSSSTLNDKGMSLHSFPVESEIFMEKSPLSIATFQSDSFIPTGQSKRRLGVAKFVTNIPACYRTNNLVVSVFKYQIKPLEVDLSSYSSLVSDIPSRKNHTESRGTEPMKIDNFFRIENVSTLTIERTAIMSAKTFHQEIPPTDKHVESSQNLKKLEEQMMSLQEVFKNVKVSRELNVCTEKQEKNCYGMVEIKQFIENSGTQTASTGTENTDISHEKIESLILECDFIRAAVHMIRLYPFYYDFLERCYSGRNDYHEQFDYLKPKQKSLKKAVVHAYRYNRSHLEAINSLLLEFCVMEKPTCLCLE